MAEATTDGKAKREELVAAARKDIETETRRSLEQIRKEVADLTVLATETLTRKSLSGSDHQKLVEEALAEVDFGALAGDQRTEVRALVEEIARVYGDALFEVANEAGKLDEVHEQLGQFADALAENRELQIFLFSPVLLLGGEARRDREGRVSGQRRAGELPRAARGEAPHARDLPHPRAISTSCGRRRTAGSRCG